MVGGPDWPTHVLAGTLGVPQLSIQVCSRPFFSSFFLSFFSSAGASIYSGVTPPYMCGCLGRSVCWMKECGWMRMTIGD